MARQGKGLTLEGTIGNLVFYKTKFGYMVRTKGSVSKRRIQSDPAFARVRENSMEFKSAGSAVRLLRTAFRPLIYRAADSQSTGRLMKVMVSLIKTDPVNPPGQRTANNGRAQLLEKFEFNQDSKLALKLHAPISVLSDHNSGRVALSINACPVDTMLSVPKGATHFRFVSAAAAIDFTNNQADVATSESEHFSTRRKRIGPVRLVHNVKKISSGHLIVLLGIEFVKISRGEQIRVANGRLDPLSVVKAEALSYDAV